MTLVSAYKRNGNRGGFTDYYNDRSHTPLYWVKSRIIASLGGLAANERKYGVFDVGGSRDLDHAFDRMRDLVVNTGMCGLSLYSYGYADANSNTLKSAQEQAVAAEIEKAYRKAKEILALNAAFFEKVAAALAQKKLLSAADMQKIKAACKIVPVAL